MIATGKSAFRERFEATLDLCQFAFEIQRARFERLHPLSSRAEIERMLGDWYREQTTDDDARYGLRRARASRFG